MYSDYGALGVDYQMLANLHQYQQMRQSALMARDCLEVLPTSKSQLVGDWRSSMRDLQKWYPTPVVMETATRYQRLNLGDETVNSALNGSGPRRCRRDSSDDERAPTDRPATDEHGHPAKRRTTSADRPRFDFTRLAESATRRDDSSPDTEIRRSNGGVKVIKYDDDQSDRRLSRNPAAAAAAVENAEKRPLMSLPHHSTTLQPLKSVFSPIEPFGRYRRHRLMIR